MAKRRRLTPAQPEYLTGPALMEPKAWLHPPIAQVAGAASATAALAEVSGEMAAARAEGRLVLRLPLAAIDADYLVRDRLGTDEDALAHLITSLREFGQRSPIEVTQTGPDRFGLISGWRRVTALGRLAAEDARYGSVLALLRHPAQASDAYIAMVEENEVRLGLSYYERARIAAKSVEHGVFETEKQALQRLFAAASRARRSKIGSFLAIYRALEGSLRFPAALTERLGLGLARALATDPAMRDRLIAALQAPPAATAAEEQNRIAAVLAGQGRASAMKSGSDTAKTGGDAQEIRPGLFLATAAGPKPGLTLTGPALTPEFRQRLLIWVQQG